MSDNDIAYLIDDLLYFLLYYPSNPFQFMNHYFTYVFAEKEYYTNQSLYGPTIRDMLADFVFTNLEK